MSDVPEEVARLLDAIEAFDAMEDDAAAVVAASVALGQWSDHHERLRMIRQRRANALKAKGMTWKEIGQLMGGITAQRAQQIGAGLSGASRKKAEAEAKKEAKPDGG